MDFLKQLLGANFKDGMTPEEISKALESLNIANLSNGEYVRKGKAEADQKLIQSKLDEAVAKLKEKMTDEEKAEDKFKELTNSNEALRKEIEQMRKDANKSKIENALSQTAKRLNLDTKSENYSNFINSIVKEDEKENNEIAKFFGDILEQSYQKGVEIKDREVTGSKDFKNNPGENKPENIGARLGKKMGVVTKVKNPYFKED